MGQQSMERSVQIKSNMRSLCTRVQTALRPGRGKRHVMEISAPFDMTLEPVCLPGVSEDELCILREKAVASRIGIAETLPRSPSEILAHPIRPTFSTTTTTTSSFSMSA